MEITFKASSARELHDHILSFCKEFGINGETSKQQVLPLSPPTGVHAHSAPLASVSAAIPEKRKPGRPAKIANDPTDFTSEPEETVAEPEITPTPSLAPTVSPSIPMDAPIAGAGHSVTKQQVSDALSKLYGAKGGDTCKALLKEFGAEKLTALAAEHYPNFVTKCHAALV